MDVANPVRVIIIEDSPVIRHDVEILLKKWPQFIVVGMCGSVQVALTLISASSPDLLLLDVRLSDGTAFDILNSPLDKKIKIILLTGYQEYALKAIKHGVTDYLLKPVNEKEFEIALNKVINRSVNTAAQPVLKYNNETKYLQRLVISTQERLQFIEFSDIMYCKSHEGYTTFYLKGNKKCLTSKYLKEYEPFLPPEYFIRTHQSYIVNINYIEGYDKNGYLILKNEIEIPVAMRRRDFVINLLNGNNS